MFIKLLFYKKNLPFLLFFSLFLFLNSACGQEEEPVHIKTRPPNIIFILTDDLGYGDIGVFFQNQRAEQGEPFHQTPNLDTMVREGMSLTRHYAPAPVCAPSRASLLQGVHQGHAGIRNNQFDKALSDNHNLATVLKEAGYATALVGKYGLQGRDGSSPETWEAYPTKRGFDHFLGYVRHIDGHNHYPAHEARERPAVELYFGNEEISGKLKGVYTTDLFTAAAKKWIADRKQVNPEQPFFLYLAYDTPHAALEVAASPYPKGGGLNGGVQWIGEEDNFINTADDTIDDYIYPDYADQDWPSQQKRFASMVRRIDNGVGDLIQLLRDLGIDENTFIVFTSDNGPHRESYGYGEYNPTLFDSFGPLDGIKRDTWEGGIRVPAIVRWPGHIPKASTNDSPTGFHDWLPTFADLAGIPAPAITDGASLVPLLTGKTEQSNSTIYVEYYHNGNTPDYQEFDSSHQNQARGEMQVIYLDGYKGIRYNITSAGDDFLIYDALEDPGETTDLAGSNDEFTSLQQRMKDRVLQLRRPDSEAVRPYDIAPVPALNLAEETISGLSYRVYEVETPWTPAISTLQKEAVTTGVSSGFDPDVRTRDHHIVLEYTGLIDVPQTGTYTFYLWADRGAVFRIHDAAVIDADKGYQAGSEMSSEIILEAGLHPVRLIYSTGEQRAPLLDLQWSGPDFSKQPIDPGVLSHRSSAE